MSDIMYPVSFGTLMQHIRQELAMHKRIYNVEQLHYTKEQEKLSLFGRPLENPLGPAAGPHTQLAQNIVAAYVGGARFIELKTVQIMFGEELGIPRPCIYSNDEAYNVEWSSEYRADQARDEYIKAWFACKLIAKEYGFGNPDAFIFNMSVGYNLEGIKSPVVDSFIEGLKHAKDTDMFRHCQAWALEHVDEFEHVDTAFINGISDNICQSITLSTMHGCPADEIESICTYLMKEKGINLYLKCNPTLLGETKVRELLDAIGYDYVQFDAHQFEVDLKFDQAVPMIERLQALGDSLGLQFGVKLSNTFPVSIKEGELPGEQMYMSGKALYPLTINLAATIAEIFEGKLPISYSGGIDRRNFKQVFDAGIWPITICTTLLQGLGYNQINGLATELEAMVAEGKGRTIDPVKIRALADEIGVVPAHNKTEIARKKRDAKPGFQDAHSDNYRCRVTCGNCVRVCPNRTNEMLVVGDERLIIHIDESCNECGNCACNCPEPCQPYRDRLTYFHNQEAFNASDNDGFYLAGDQWGYRFQGTAGVAVEDSLPEPLKGVVKAFVKDLPYYL